MTGDVPEEIDAVPVLEAEGRAVEPARGAGPIVPVGVQTAAVVGASMVAGAAAVALARRRKSRRMQRRRRKALAPVLASRSFLVDVHVLGERK